MADDGGIDARRIPDTPFGVIVHIGTANTYGSDGNLDFAGRRRGGGLIDEPELAHSSEFSNLHAIWVTLLFEETVEGSAGIAGAARLDYLRSCSRLVGAIAGASDVTSDGDARFEELTLVLLILIRDACRDWLQTLKTGGRLKVGALLAAMEWGVALWTVALEVDVGG